MYEISLNMTVPHLVIPIICTGTLFISTSLFILYFIRFREKVYLTMMLNGIAAFVFVGSNCVVTIMGELLNHVEIGVQFHRIEQLGGAFFLFCLPLILANLLTLNEKWLKVNKIIAMCGLGFAVVIIFSAFISPDFYISQTTFQERTLNMTWYISRGREGFLYSARDTLLAMLIIYSLVCIVTDLIWHRKYKNILFILIGLLFGFLGAIDDTLRVYTGHYLGIFSNVSYSRFSAGVTLFILSVKSGIINQFINGVKSAEIAYKEKNNMSRSLRKTSERFKQLAENINEVFMIFDYSNEVYIYISPAFENIWHYSRKILFESPQLLFDMLHRDDRDFVKSSIGDGKIREKYDIEYRIICPDKSIRWIRDRGFPVKNEEGKIYRMVRTQEDITDRKKSEEELVYLAYHDILTGFLNRRSFFERLHDTVVQSKRETQSLIGILIIHVGELKTINTSFGDDFGDKILKIYSDKLRECVRETDYLFRLSGTEFAVILKNLNAETDASIVAGKIISELQKPINCEKREVVISCCIGISIYPKDSAEPEILIKNSQIALTEAKNNRNYYRFFDEQMNARALERLAIEHNLRYALVRNEFEIYYQPFLNISGKITGMEALMRWTNPSLGSVPPIKFIPVMESTGDIIVTGEWVLRTACLQLKSWQESGYNGFRIAVNISAVQLSDRKFVERVASVLKETGLDPKFLELEITESSVMKNPDDAIKKTNKLHEMGIFISIDDFGIDYSSLSYIKHFKISRLKIDRSFIMDILFDNVNAEITRAIIGMAHNLNIEVTAEGIETIKQKEFLAALNCDEMQGYLYSKPVPADEFTRLLENGGHLYPN